MAIWKSLSGFISGQSIATNLTLFVDGILGQMRKHGLLDTIYTGFAKIFDRVIHKLLIQELRLLGLGGRYATLIFYFLP